MDVEEVEEEGDSAGKGEKTEQAVFHQTKEVFPTRGGYTKGYPQHFLYEPEISTAAPAFRWTRA